MNRDLIERARELSFKRPWRGFPYEAVVVALLGLYVVAMGTLGVVMGLR